MVPVATTPPMLSGTVSLDSTSLSWTVGTITLKLVTPAGTVTVPSALSVTPLLNSGALKSAVLALPPPSTKWKVVGVADAWLSVAA